MSYLSDNKFHRGLVDGAMAVADKLQDFFNENAAGSVTPTVEVSINFYEIALEIGDCMVWLSGENSQEELTFDYCLAQYREHIRSLTPFLETEQQCPESPPTAT